MGLKSLTASDFDHGALQGLGDDDHTQYVLRSILTTDGDLFSRNAGAVVRIAAVATGQVFASAGTGTLPAWSATPTLTSLTCPTLDGGTAANDDITIQGTTHATRTSSYVLLQPNGGFVGIGLTGPVAPFHSSFDNNANEAIMVLENISDSATNRGEFLNFRQGSAATVVATIGHQNTSVFGDTTAQTFIASRVSGEPLTFMVGGHTAEKMRITSDGVVGLATDAPTISGTGKLHMAADTFRLATARTPASAGAAGNAGDICWDASFIYVCTATNAWERVGIASW